MRFLNLMRRTLQTLSVIACGIVWLPAQVLALGDAIPQSTTALGLCPVYREDNGEGFAFVSLGKPLVGSPVSGDSYYTIFGIGGVRTGFERTPGFSSRRARWVSVGSSKLA